MRTHARSFWLHQTIVKPVREGDLAKLEKWAHEHLMRSNKSKSKVLHLSQGNLRHNYRLGDKLLERSMEKDLRVAED